MNVKFGAGSIIPRRVVNRLPSVRRNIKRSKAYIVEFPQAGLAVTAGITMGSESPEERHGMGPHGKVAAGASTKPGGRRCCRMLGVKATVLDL